MSDSTNVCVVLVDDGESLCRSPTRPFRASGMQLVTHRSAEGFLANAVLFAIVRDEEAVLHVGEHHRPEGACRWQLAWASG